MAFQLATNLEMGAKIPLDTRAVVGTTVERDSITQVYPGLTVYVTGENKYYYYNTDNDWVEFGSSQNLVYITGNQTISGVKNFASRPTVNGTGVLLSGEAVEVDLSNYATVTNLASTGSTLQGQINNLGNTYATVTNLASTGSTLQGQINSLSGAAVQSNGTITRMIRLTQAQYNALSPKDPTTFYVIVG